MAKIIHNSYSLLVLHFFPCCFFTPNLLDSLFLDHLVGKQNPAQGTQYSSNQKELLNDGDPGETRIE